MAHERETRPIGVLGVVFRKAQNRIQDPAELKRLVVDLVDEENWSASGTDIKGDAYESLLGKGAEDVTSGAGQYFPPRSLIHAMVDCLQPTVRDVVDPAAGTGGFLMVAHEYAARDGEDLTPEEREHLRDGIVHDVELVDGTTQHAAMNLILHGIGKPRGEGLIEVKDALLADPGRRWSVVLSADHPWTERLWVYDLRTDEHFTLNQNPLRRSHLDDAAATSMTSSRRTGRVSPATSGSRTSGSVELAVTLH